jgi:hypothetical protein
LASALVDIGMANALASEGGLCFADALASISVSAVALQFLVEWDRFKMVKSEGICSCAHSQKEAVL